MSLKKNLATLAVAAWAGMALPASAISFGLEVFNGDTRVIGLTEGQLGCVDVTGTPTANCNGAGANLGNLSIDSWSVFVDADPVITGIIAVTNNTLTTQQYTLLFTLPIFPAIPGGTVTSGSVQGGVTDNNGNGATLSAPALSSFYTARIDGVDFQTLYNAPASVTAAAWDSANLAAVSFGLPGVTQPGPAALANIGIRLDFLLTAGDSASFTSNFVVLPAAVVPVPAAAWLFGGALGLLGFARRRLA